MEDPGDGNQTGQESPADCGWSQWQIPSTTGNAETEMPSELL